MFKNLSEKNRVLLLNLITASRLLFAGFLGLIKLKTGNIGFLITIALLLGTDAIDGYLARKYKITTLGGSVLDAAADKILLFSILLIMAKVDPVFYLEIFIEVLIFLNAFRGFSNKAKVQTSKIGRIKMLFLSTSLVISAFLRTIALPNIIASKIILVIAIFVIGIQFAVFVNYFKAYKGKKEPKKKKEKREFKKFKDIWNDLFDPSYMKKHGDNPDRLQVFFEN